MKTLHISIFNGHDWDISAKPVSEQHGGRGGAGPAAVPNVASQLGF